MQRHQRDRARLGIVLVEVGDERDRFEERLHPRQSDRAVGDRAGLADADATDRREPANLAALDLFVERAGRSDELLQVLDATVRLHRPFGLELGEIAALRQHGFQGRADAARRLHLDLVDQFEEIAQPSERLAGHARGRGFARRGLERDARALRVRVELRDRRVAHAAAAC